MKYSPTPRQLEVLKVIHHHQVQHGFPITMRELGNVLGIASTKGVFDHLAALAKKGLVTRETRRARSLVITPQGRKELAA